MNRTKTILAAVGGFTLVAVAAAGYYAWSAQSAKTAAFEGNDDGVVGLDAVRERAERLSRKPVYPDAESVLALTGQRDEMSAWKDEARAFVARGDRRIQPTTDAKFKDFIVGDARRLQSLPAGQDQKTLDPTFDFGPFKPYISEGKMPEQATLGELQRKWDDVATLIETLSGCGVARITSVDVKAAEKKPEEEEATSKKKGKKQQKKTASKLPDTSASQPVSYTYVIACQTRPDGLVKALNALATSERFMTVGDFTLRRGRDAIAEALGAEKKDESAPTTGRRRRRGAAAAEAAEQAEKTAEKPAEEALFTVVTDPVAEDPLDVVLTVTVSDFRTAEAAQEGEGEETK